ncbi:hypothetical protein FA15DRAFT_758273 [Coprinopsis marcescibilis]|uniref:Uncharacterized protein n=1 Tax=Coprinopsis marcescibilis TaxID=230819 RepID=A0A5C3KP05_COPMA|nr:hypothetical protein FA15DRAFT_758273 [Coprinopsis marcescibilis]
MQFKILVAFAALFAAQVVHAAEGDVHTVIKVVPAIIDVEPYLVEVTETVVYTQGPSITATYATVIPTLIDETIVYGDDQAAATPAPEAQ